MAKAMVYIQSGGPTSVINTSLYGAIQEAKKHPEISNIYGSLNGIEGLLTDNLIDLRKEDDEQIELLKQTPGSILGTSRHKLPKDFHDEEYKKILETCKKHDIGYVFVNGGNDSMDTCHKLSLLCKELGVDIKVMGVPKTVDNDLAETDHSLGFASAAKYVINTVKEICIDAVCYKKGKVYVIEIMGRNAGWLTAAVDLLPEGIRPDLIYLPENKFDMADFLAKVQDLYNKKATQSSQLVKELSSKEILLTLVLIASDICNLEAQALISPRSLKINSIFQSVLSNYRFHNVLIRS